MNDRVANLEEVTPNAADFIQSIAEQGYRLETALADLVDNAISAEANKIEVLIDTSETPFSVFIADNGRGMSASKLSEAMSFPSQSLANAREQKDLGRFGLGLKTASFSQTQEFSILSRPNGAGSFNGKTWDLKLLREEGGRYVMKTRTL